jgi:hypothetical protein
MTIENALVTLVTTDPALFAMIGDRFDPGTIPLKKKLPAACYQVIGNTRTSTQDGPAGVAMPRFQITIDAKEVDEAKEVMRAMRKRLDGFVGNVGAVKIFVIVLENEYDGSNNLETGICTVRQDYKVSWSETL